MPLTDKITMPDTSSVYIWHIEETEAQLKEKYKQLIAQGGFEEEVENIKVLRKRKQWYASRLLSFEVIPDFKGLYYDQFGAPHLIEDDRCVSYSHSHDKVALIIHDDHEVGIDIQREDEKLRRISSKFLNEQEAERFIDSGESLDYLHVLWSVKETVFKVHKHHMPFKEIRTAESVDAQQGVMKVVANRFDGPHNHEVHFHKLNGYFVAHCCYTD
ncbi:MAG: 4'-phosphopantetheinyl transferase superfamily protein [Flavobacteriales bacterium]|nr:4'-phosphopantetheinyl transferase superfamily protein [Flavobacteriales bacterium]